MAGISLGIVLSRSLSGLTFECCALCQKCSHSTHITIHKFINVDMIDTLSSPLEFAFIVAHMLSGAIF